MARLDGRIALITGAAQGLGEAIAHRMAVEGCAGVAVADRNGEKAVEVAHAVAEKHGVRTIGITVDVTDSAQTEAMVVRTVAELGGLDILIANAGILIAHDVIEFPAEQWRKVIDVNLVGCFNSVQAAAKHMVPLRKGAIVQVNSKSGKKGSFRNSAYAASKFGGIGLVQSVALDLAPHGIRINAVCPGNLLDGTLWQESLFNQYAKNQGLTPEDVRKKYESQVPLGRGCTYDDVCNVVAFLASDESSYMTGQAINVTGGQEMR